MRESGLPFDDIRNLVEGLPAEEVDVKEHTLAQLIELGIPATDKLASICGWYSGFSGRSPAVHRGVVTLFAGTHKLDDKISDGEASAEIVEQVTAISEGSAALNRLCNQHDLALKLFDLALQLPVADISEEAALDEKACAGTIAFGMEAVAGGADLLGVAALEPRVSVSNLALLSILHEVDSGNLASEFGVPQDALEAAISLANGQQGNPLELLRRLGGRETAALCGAILAARSQHIPVVLDGLTAFVAASVLARLNKDAVLHCMFAQPGNVVTQAMIGSLGIGSVFSDRLTEDPLRGIVLASGMVKSACLLKQT